MQGDGAVMYQFTYTGKPPKPEFITMVDYSAGDSTQMVLECLSAKLDEFMEEQALAC
jgi:hypothetical protein